MPIYSDGYYNSAALLGGKDIPLGSITKIPLFDLRKTFARRIQGGWSIPPLDELFKIPPPSADMFTQMGKWVLDPKNGIIGKAETVKLQEALENTIKIPEGWTNDMVMQVVSAIIGAQYLYDTFLLMSTKEVGRDLAKLTKEQMMLARNKAAIIAQALKAILAPLGPITEDWARMIYSTLHTVRGTTRKEILQRMAQPGPYTDVDPAMLPKVDERGFGIGTKRITPWSSDWNKLTPELSARAIQLLNKTTKKGVTLDPDTLVKASQGYIPNKEELEQEARAWAEENEAKRKAKKKSKKAKTVAKKRPRKKTSKKKDEEFEIDEEDIVEEVPMKKKKRKTTKRKKKGGSFIWDNYLTQTYGY